MKKKNNLGKILIIIGILPFVFMILWALYSAIVGTSSCFINLGEGGACGRIYGFEAFGKETLLGILLLFVAFPFVGFGFIALLISGITIKIVEKFKKKSEAK